MPAIVVCVCTRRREHLLGRTLSALRRADLGRFGGPDGVGLLVVDNAPGEGSSRSLCERLAPSMPMPLRYVGEPRAGLPFARNRAVAEALGWGARLVAFVDDDDEPAPDWLLRLLDAQVRTGADLVFGAWAHSPELRLPRWLAGLRAFRPIDLDEVNSYGFPGWAGTFNLLLTRRLLEDLGARGPVFRPEFAAGGAEDTDLFVRAHRAGFAHAVAGDSVITRHWEPERLTVRGMLRRSFNTGGTRMLLATLHEPPERARAIRRRALRELVRTAGKLPKRLHRPERLGPTLAQIAQYAGQVYAGTGRQFRYYQDDAPAERSRRPGSADTAGAGERQAARQP